ncbi:MAG TPA: hypothetical protein VHC49_01185 [Mycobacteriales bacterium]|nr:hypothetical protein [Mycobacteriales bacterium]
MRSGFGAGGRDAEAEAASRRSAEAFAKDIGDYDALARSGTPRHRRPVAWLGGFLLLVVVVAAYGAATGHSGHVPITKSCRQPALALKSLHADVGHSVPWSATGPDRGRYLLAIGGGAVTATKQNITVRGGSPGSGIFAMAGCLTRSELAAPRKAGTYPVRLMHDVDGRYVEVDRLQLTVG